MKNPNCENVHCTAERGEVRLLPAGGGGNMILCRACFNHELNYRHGRNVIGGGQWDLPRWEDLKVYESE